MESKRTLALALGILVLIGAGIAALASRAWDAAREREVPLPPVALNVNGDLGPVIATRGIEPVDGGARSPTIQIPESTRSSDALPTPAPPAVRAVPAPRIAPQGPAAPPAAREPASCVAELGIPAALVGDGRTADLMALASVTRGGALHLGTGAVGSVWSEAFTFTPSLTDALTLAWTGIRYRVSPNTIAAFAMKESRYDCARYGDGCFQITSSTFDELQRQFPQALRSLAFTLTVQSRVLAPQVAALHLRFNEHLFRWWYPWDAFIERARDPNVRLKLLARAYNRGAWDQNLGYILTRDADRCAGIDDLLTCFDDHAIVRDHAASITAYASKLGTLPGYDHAIDWENVRAFLESGVRPLASGANWPRLLTIARTGYDCLATTAHRFTFRTELPRLFVWLAASLSPVETPQTVSDYRAPVTSAHYPLHGGTIVRYTGAVDAAPRRRSG